MDANGIYYGTYRRPVLKPEQESDNQNLPMPTPKKYVYFVEEAFEQQAGQDEPNIRTLAYFSDLAAANEYARAVYDMLIRLCRGERRAGWSMKVAYETFANLQEASINPKRDGMSSFGVSYGPAASPSANFFWVE
ncbi:hypothetical protein LTR09_010940 [Extremus antarcticus]|uniref:Uncharacterized protein n=1 Tax=Extremus antarcticus TaxID=702011 RepID=A0AAJ0G803_9PEZI|nr:hypothetical protein LTR09_010940 [Extremus antarcticus]